MKRESFEPSPELESSARIEGEREERPKRSRAEVLELQDRLRFVARTLSQNFGLRLIPGKGWAAGLSEKFQEERRKHPKKSLEEFDEKLLMPEIMTYPEKDLLEKSEDYVFGVFRHEVGHLKHSDYQALLESQDRAKQEGYSPMDLFFIYDAWEDGRSNGMEAGTSKAAKHRLGSYLKEDLAEAMLHDFEKKPLPIQYGLLCWAKGAEPFIKDFDFGKLKEKVKDEKVLEAYAKTEEVLQEYLREEKGRRAFDEILWQKGWPVFKELIDKYVEQEAQEQHQSGQEGLPKDQQKSWDGLSEQEKEQLRKQVREKLTNEEREFVIHHNQESSNEIKEKKDGTIEIIRKEVSPEDIKKAEQEEKEYLKGQEEQKHLTEEEKEKLAQQAKEALERIKERETGLTETEREKYNKYYSEVKKYVNLLVERLDEIFPPREEEGWEGGQPRGKRIDVRKLAREAPTERGQFFERKDVPEIKELAFSLLIDVSGSMRKGKINEALKAAILMAEAFSQKGVPFEILAFHEKLIELKGFEEKYFGKKKLDIMRVLKEVETSHANWNDDGFAVEEAARRLQKRLLESEAFGALIIFSDGEPVPSSKHAGPEWELHQIVDKWTKRVPLVGVGIGPGMEDTIKEYYGKNGLPVPEIDQLPRALLKILDSQVSRYEKRVK